MSRRKAVVHLRRKAALLLFLRHAAGLAAVWGLAWGTIVIALRAALGHPRPSVWWGAAGLVLALVLAAEWARRRLPALSAFRAAVDQSAGLGGMLMSEAERSLGAWESRLPESSAFRVRWRGGRAFLRLLGAALFVLTSFLVPQRFVDASAPPPLDIQREAERLSEQIDALLEEEVALEKMAALEEELARLQEEASGEDPAKTWEALDHIEQELMQAAAEAAEEALTETERLAMAQSLAEALQHDGSQLSDALLKEAASALSSMLGDEGTMKRLMDAALSGDNAESLLNAMAEAGSQLSPEQLAQLAENAESLLNAVADAGSEGGSRLSSEQLAQLADLLRSAKGDLSECLSGLCEAGLVPAEALQKLAGLAESDSSGLAEFLSACREAGMGGSIEGLMAARENGLGGVNRGPGSAPLSWDDPSSEEGVEFHAETLPLSQLPSLEESRLMKISAAAPELNEEGVSPHVDALRGAQAGGGSAQTQRLLPRHKGAVQRYFERSSDSAGERSGGESR